jgi:hypothetical protein
LRVDLKIATKMLRSRGGRREEGGGRRRPDPEKEEGVELRSRGERGGEEGTAQIREESPYLAGTHRRRA